ncbi:MAG: hypothetical protein DMG38_05435 [Acidobacteria bacterium]|nr:MAG: hypothetical protein DMG38_05435 [Acidobacteriota bacterium]
MESSHEYFDLLCAMVGANQASEEEERLLTEHAEACRECRQAVEQYRQIAWRIYEEEVGTETRQEAANLTEQEASEREKAKQRLLRELPGTATLPRTRERLGVLPRVLETETPSRRGVPSWASWAVAASLLIAVGVNSVQYWESKRHSGDAEARAVSLQRELDGLRDELAKERTERLQAAASQNVQAAPSAEAAAISKSNETQKLRAENEALRANLASSEAAREQQARDFIAQRDRERLLQASLDVFQASKSTLEVENTDLLAKVSKLTDDLKKSQEDLAGLSARNEALSQETLSKVKYAERQQKLLATDHDIRDILGSRSLHIIDVYDVSGQGELERPFGRIFYTEGKSLIFYAFDLDLQKELKRRAVFQAWGQKSEGKESPRSLGTFYMDDSAQNRWVLKVDDNKTLSRIDYVYVTDSSRKETVKPKGKPLLSAFLNGPANHP